MLIRIEHETRYRYSRAVFLEPLTVRLTPRQDATQRLLEHELAIEPSPDGLVRTIEPGGTDAHVAWFSDEHALVTIRTRALVETLRANPFDYLVIDEGARALPAAYPSALEPVLAPCRGGAIAGEVHAWASEIAGSCGGETVGFLAALTERLHAGWSSVERADGDPFVPERTLEARSGSCRDVAALFVAACRTQGLAARFVSGYSTHHPEGTTEHELHAWAEVYLPGGGWRGFDPSLGLAVADGHVALASGPDHVLAAPVSGSYRGTGVTSALEYDIRVAREAT